jgi:hypothetical protein
MRSACQVTPSRFLLLSFKTQQSAFPIDSITTDKAEFCVGAAEKIFGDDFCVPSY